MPLVPCLYLLWFSYNEMENLKKQISPACWSFCPTTVCKPWHSSKSVWTIILSIIVRCAKLNAFARRADNKLRLLVQKRSSHPSHFVTKDKFRLVPWGNRGRKLPFHSKHFLKPFGNPKCMTNNEHSESFATRLQFKVWLLGVKHKIERSYKQVPSLDTSMDPNRVVLEKLWKFIRMEHSNEK